MFHWLDTVRNGLAGFASSSRRTRQAHKRSRSRHFAASASSRYSHHALVEPLEERKLLAVDLVYDITPNSGNWGLGQIGALTQLGALGLFFANDGVHGTELWKTDGTSAGTALVRDINPGTDASAPIAAEIPASVNGFVYFAANDGVTGYELWKSDGTCSGTMLVSDIFAGEYYYEYAYSSGGTYVPNSSRPVGLAAVGNQVFFVANDGVTGKELWKSDGSSSGTLLVRDISPGLSGPGLTNTMNVSGKLFFSASNVTNGSELWSSDGTCSGTSMVFDVRPGSGSSSPYKLYNHAGTLYFKANDGVTGVELWRSDGMSSGTVLVKDIRPGVGTSDISGLTTFGGALYFSATDGVAGAELWKSDGTATGTTLVKDIFSGANSSYPTGLTSFNGAVYFAAANSGAGNELWKSDGTSSGTTLVKDLWAGSSGSSPGAFTVANGKLVFAARDNNLNTNQGKVWKSDGTSTGTVLLREFYTGTTASSVRTIQTVDGRLYINANDGSHGWELWTWNGLENVSPVSASAGGPYTMLGGQALNLAATAVDPDATLLNSNGFQWDLNGDGNYTDAIGQNPSVPWNNLISLGIARDAASFDVRVRYDDLEGGATVVSTSTTVTITNAPPIARAGGPYTITEGNAATLSASSSSDPEGGALTYSWDVNGDGTFGEFTSFNPTVSWSYLLSQGIGYQSPATNVRVRVTDIRGASTISAPTTITVNSLAVINELVTAIRPGDSVTFDQVAIGAMPGPVTYAWDFNGDGNFSDASGSAPTLSWAQLQTWGISATNTLHPLKSRLTNPAGAISTVTTYLLVTDRSLGDLNPELLDDVNLSYLYLGSANKPGSAVALISGAGYIEGYSPLGNGLWRHDGGASAPAFVLAERDLASGAGKFYYQEPDPVVELRTNIMVWDSATPAAPPSVVTFFNDGDQIILDRIHAQDGGVSYHTYLDGDPNDFAITPLVGSLQFTSRPHHWELTRAVAFKGRWQWEGDLSYDGGGSYGTDTNYISQISFGNQWITTKDYHEYDDPAGPHVEYSLQDRGTLQLLRTEDSLLLNRYYRTANYESFGGGPVVNTSSYTEYSEAYSTAGTAATGVTGTFVGDAGGIAYFVTSQGVLRSNSGVSVSGLTPRIEDYMTRDVNGTFYFWANDGVHGMELWKSNGSTAGTVMVADVTPGPAGTTAAEMYEYDDQLVFVADGKLYVTVNGGTSVAVVDTPPIPAGSRWHVLGTVGDKLWATIQSAYSPLLGNGWFQFDAQDLHTNRPPTAPGAGGPYDIVEGASLTVSAAASSDPDPGDVLTYSWDINGDNVFGDATGLSPTLSWAQLNALGINSSPATFNVRVRVDDGHGHTVDSPATTLHITPAPEIGIAFGAVQLTDGDTTPTTTDGSDFGAPAAGVAPIRQWTITNTGPGVLDLSGGVTITGPNASDFSVTTPPAVTSLASGQSTTFRVRFAPVAGGVRNATVLIHNNDVNESPFDFAITGIGSASLTPAEIDVTVDATSIPDGGTAPAGSGATGWDNLSLGTSVTRNFSVTNAGTAALLLTGAPIVTITGPNEADFSVITMPGPQIRGLGASVMAIRFAPTAIGDRTATVTIVNTDSNENPYDFTITGIGGTAITAGGTGGYRGESRNFTFTTADVSTTAGFRYDIDWDNDGTIDQTFNSTSSSQVVPHVSYTSGTQSLRITITDLDDNTAGTTTLPVTTTDYALRPNADNPALMDLVWGGSAGDDSVVLTQTGASDVNVQKLLDDGVAMNVTQAVSGVTGRVIAYGNPGNDSLDGSGLSTKSATLDGGAGNNTLRGGNGGDILIGGTDGAEGGTSGHPDGDNVIIAGNGTNTIYGNAPIGKKEQTGGDNIIIGGTGVDTIYGNYGVNNQPMADGGEGGHNIIIGGAGADTLYTTQSADGGEGAHGSIAIAGTTTYGNSPAGIAALQSILAEWSSGHATSAKVAFIQGTGGTGGLNGANYLTAGGTVLSDAAVDTIFGDTNGSAHWFFYRLSEDLLNRTKTDDILTPLP